MNVNTSTNKSNKKFYANGLPETVSLVCPQCGKDALLSSCNEPRKRHFDPTLYYGNITCTNCGKVKSIEGTSYDKLFETFPLYFQVPTRYGTIWAFNREHLISLKEIIESKFRSEKPPENGWLYSRVKLGWKLPSWMLSNKNRDYLSKAISNFLAVKN